MQLLHTIQQNCCPWVYPLKKITNHRFQQCIHNWRPPQQALATSLSITTGSSRVASSFVTIHGPFTTAPTQNSKSKDREAPSGVSALTLRKITMNLLHTNHMQMAIHQSPCPLGALVMFCVSVQRSQNQDYYNICSQILRRQILHQKALKRGTVHISLTRSLSFIFCDFYFYAQNPANKKFFHCFYFFFFLISQPYLLINFKFQLMGMSIWYFSLSCFTLCTL